MFKFDLKSFFSKPPQPNPEIVPKSRVEWRGRMYRVEKVYEAANGRMVEISCPPAQRNPCFENDPTSGDEMSSKATLQKYPGAELVGGPEYIIDGNGTPRTIQHIYIPGDSRDVLVTELTFMFPPEKPSRP